MRGNQREWFGLATFGVTVALGILASGGGYPTGVTAVLWLLVVIGCVVAVTENRGWWPFSPRRINARLIDKAKPQLQEQHASGRALIPEDPGLKNADTFSRLVENWEAQVVATFDQWDLHREAERFGPAERPHGDSHAAGTELRRRLEILEDIIRDMDA